MVVYTLELLMTIEKHVFSFCDIHLSTKIRQLTYANQQPTKSPSFGGQSTILEKKDPKDWYRMKQSQWTSKGSEWIE